MSTQKPIYDKKDQLEKTHAWLLPGETLYAVLDMKGGGTGFLGITDKRLIFYDKAFMRKKKAMVTIPYSKITAISSEDSSGLLLGRGFFATSTLEVQVGSQSFEFDFRGADKAHLAYSLIMPHLLD